eukprot:jgi/Hompol1/6344/HPOL_000883-RA
MQLDASRFRSAGSLTLAGPSSPQRTDFFLPVWRQSTSQTTGSGSDTVGAVLVFLYSGQHECLGEPKWGCVTPAQLEWLQISLGAYLDSLRPAIVPVALFMHIPSPEVMAIANYWPIHGTVGEAVACPSIDTHLISTLTRLNVITVQFGHDHYNDFRGNLVGGMGSIGNVTFMYGKKTGYGSYGPANGVQHGGRVLQLHANRMTFESWIRLEDGSIDAQIDSHLSGTRQYRCYDSTLLPTWLAEFLTHYGLAAVVFLAMVTALAIIKFRLRRIQARAVRMYQMTQIKKAALLAAV